MSTVTNREDIATWSSRISWGALFAGGTFSVGVWILLHVLGLAAGLTSIDPNSPSSLRAAGIGTGIWSILASLIALFAGGAVAARIAGPVDRLNGALHGAVLWALTTVTALVFIASIAGMAIGGAARAGGAVAGLAGDLAEGRNPLQALGINATELLTPLNQQLQAQGKPPVTPEQLQEALREGVRTGVQQGHFDREVLIGALVRSTSLTRADVTELANQVDQRAGRLGERIERMQTGALQAAESTGKGLWWVFGSLLLGLFAAIGGALSGVSAQQRRIVERERIREAAAARDLPLGPPAHVPT